MSYSNIDWTLEGLEDSADVTETETTVNENGDNEESKTTTKTVEEDKEQTESNDTSDTNDDDTDESSDTGEETQTDETGESASSDTSVKTEENEIIEDVDSDEILTTMLEVNDIEADINEDTDTIENSITTLEALENFYKTGWVAVGTGGFDRNGAMLFNSSLEGFASILGTEKDFFKTGVSLENFSGVSGRTSATIASLEGLGESISKVWKRLIEFIQKSFEKIKKLLNELLNGIAACNKKADKILEQCKKITTTQTRFPLDEKYSKYLLIGGNLVSPYQAAMQTSATINEIMSRKPGERINKLINVLTDKLKNDFEQFTKSANNEDGANLVNSEDSRKELINYIKDFMSGSSTNGYDYKKVISYFGIPPESSGNVSYIFNISKPLPLNSRYAEVFNIEDHLFYHNSIVRDELITNKTAQSLNKDEIIKLVDVVKKLLKTAEDLNTEARNNNENKKKIKDKVSEIYNSVKYLDRHKSKATYLDHSRYLILTLLTYYDNPNRKLVYFILDECNGLLNICKASLKANSKEDKKQD